MSKIAKFGGEILENMQNMRLRSLQILYILYYGKVLPLPQNFGHVVRLFVRNTKIYKLCKGIFSVFYSISPPNLALLLISGSSF